MTNKTNNPALKALCDWLCVPVEKATEETWNHWGLTVYIVDGTEYAVGTDEEADAAAKDCISESLWAFKSDFILRECGLDLSGAESLAEMQSTSCEDAQPFIKSLIDKTCGVEEFYQEAIKWDGRGHFLSGYDGKEIELPNNFFAYEV